MGQAENSIVSNVCHKKNEICVNFSEFMNFIFSICIQLVYASVQVQIIQYLVHKPFRSIKYLRVNAIISWVQDGSRFGNFSSLSRRYDTTCSGYVLSLQLQFSCTELVILLSYCGLVDAKITASEKDLPVLLTLVWLLLT